MTRTKLGKSGETDVAQKLRDVFQASVIQMPYNSPFDLLVNGIRVEVKRCTPSRRMRWEVNIHRHGKVNEGSVDVYIFCLDKIPGNGKMPVYLLLKAPLGTPRIAFSFSSLVRKYRDAIDNWSLLNVQKTLGKRK